MYSTINSFFKIKDNNDLGQKLFYIGLLFLPSALPIAIICFFCSLIISYKFNKIIFLNDNLDLLFLLSLFLIIISSIYTSFFNLSEELIPKDRINIWLSLFNWIPLFFFYWGFQNYLNTHTKRLTTIKFLIAGTIPVLVSCAMQYFLHLYGPFKSFFDLIIWFNKPLKQIGGVSGLFSNPNYAGLFLTLTLPFMYFLIKNKNHNFISKFILISITILILYFSICTNSRNASIGIIISLLSIINKQKILYFIFFLISGFYLFVNYFSNILKNIFNLNFINLKDFCYANSNFILFCKFIQYSSWSSFDRTRIWLSTISIIKEKPLFGYGSSTFTSIYPYKNLFLVPYKYTKVYHSHNLFLELAYSFGIPVALILLISMIAIVIVAFRKLKLSNGSIKHLLDKAWLYSFIIILISHFFDITLYDGKISLIFIILLTGIRCSNLDNHNFKNNLVINN